MSDPSVHQTKPDPTLHVKTPCVMPAHLMLQGEQRGGDLMRKRATAMSVSSKACAWFGTALAAPGWKARHLGCLLTDRSVLLASPELHQVRIVSDWAVARTSGNAASAASHVGALPQETLPFAMYSLRPAMATVDRMRFRPRVLSSSYSKS